ncbi:MAG: raffinose/stachyose/melibiose transport system substrate-binding protein [Propionibacteriaceae bacterium]|jgi:raffinose/stachyose/melibiose transport system substrate-binding protein|nr:Raffinose/stachyose/melibiose transport system substrate-binding protein [Propionibacteriaceae bacterium]MDX6321472.1 raffinose/stachyose/melibiose transport system substrate-binding protein [Propionibacteriaceae bacterium]
MTGNAFTRRGFLGLSASAAAAFGLAACTGTGGASTQNSAPATKDMRMFTYEGDETIGLLKTQVKNWDATADMTTTVDSLPGSGAAQYPDKLRTELLGGKGPDLWRIWGGQIGSPFATAKQAADLAPYYEKFGWGDRINENAVAGMTFDGVKSGVPFLVAAVGAWTNQELFAKAKIDNPPTSYAELEEANDRLLAAGITPLGTGGKYGWHIMRLFEYLLESTAGPELHDKLLVGAESWDRPEVVEAFTRFKKWQDKKWIPEGALGLDPSDIEPAFVQGKTAYTIAGTWVEAAFIVPSKKPASDFSTFLLPTDQSVVRHSGFVEGYMINANSGNKDKAAELIDFIVKPETQKALQNTSSTVTGAEPEKSKLPLSAEWAEINKTSPFYTIQDQAFPKKQADQYFTVQSDILQGKITPAESAKQMQEIISAWVQK